MYDFKKKNSFESRKNEAIRIMQKYGNRVPIIVERSKTEVYINDIDKHKYLVPKDLTIGQFMHVIRKRIKLTPEQSIFLFIGNILPTSSTLMSNLYDKYKDADFFLYMFYASENTFGKKI